MHPEHMVLGLSHAFPIHSSSLQRRVKGEESAASAQTHHEQWGRQVLLIPGLWGLYVTSPWLGDLGIVTDSEKSERGLWKGTT